MSEVTEKTLGSMNDFIEIASGIVAAYVSNNPTPVSELPRLIQSVHGAISSLESGAVPRAPALVAQAEKLTPVQIRKSVREDGIVSFIDGKTYKTLKRHLTSHGLDPRGYRDRYGLPAVYPMVAPSYAEKRSALAKAIGLGQRGAMAKQELKGRKAA